MSKEQLETIAKIFPINLEDIESNESLEFPAYDETQVNNF